MRISLGLNFIQYLLSYQLTHLISFPYYSCLSYYYLFILIFILRFDYFVFRNHMCIIFELLHINLYELIKKNKFQGFSLQLVRKFAHSLLQCLDALNKFKIIHCDMKPENILLKQQGRSGIKVAIKLRRLLTIKKIISYFFGNFLIYTKNMFFQFFLFFYLLFFLIHTQLLKHCR